MSKDILNDAIAVSDRRRFLRNTGTVSLSATAIALLGGCETLAGSNTGMSGEDAASKDTEILNVALGLEHEAINAYQLGAESGLLEQGVLNVAVLFQGQHKEHRDALAATIEKLGGTPVEAKMMSEYAEALQADTLKNQTDVLTLAARLERGAANAYLGVVPSFSDDALAKVAARIAADETMHWTVLAQALGESLPENALSFGA